ncbi:hypothetical protein GCM10023222_47750 [Saccharopolyspora cebuensis]
MPCFRVRSRRRIVPIPERFRKSANGFPPHAAEQREQPLPGLLRWNARTRCRDPFPDDFRLPGDCGRTAVPVVRARGMAPIRGREGPRGIPVPPGANRAWP